MAEQKEKSFLEKVKDNLPLLSIVLVTFSTARLIAYYHYFGIDITSYIELTEAITLSTPIFFYALLASLLGIFGGLLGIKVHSEYTPTAEAQVSKNFFKRAHQFASPFTMLLLFLIIPCITIWLSWSYWYKGKPEAIEWIVSMNLLLILILTVDISSNELWLQLRKINLEISIYSLNLSLRLIFGTAAIVLQTRIDAYNAVYGDYNNREQVAFTIGDKNIHTSDKYRYVGRTKNYLFLYNNTTGYADIFKLSDIKSFSSKGAEPHLTHLPKQAIAKPNTKPNQIKVIADTVKSK